MKAQDIIDTLGFKAFTIPFSQREAKRPKRATPLKPTVCEFIDAPDPKYPHVYSYTMRTRTFSLITHVSIYDHAMRHIGGCEPPPPEGDGCEPMAYLPGTGWVKDSQVPSNWLASLSTVKPWPF